MPRLSRVETVVMAFLITACVAVMVLLGGLWAGWFDTYVVLAVEAGPGVDGRWMVTCLAEGTDRVREVEWEPLEQVAPELGEQWLCNE